MAGETPIQWQNSGGFKGVKFGIPPLKTETIYIVQVVRKRMPKSLQQGNMQLNYNSNQGGSNFEQKKVSQNLGSGQSIDVRRSRNNFV